MINNYNDLLRKQISYYLSKKDDNNDNIIDYFYSLNEENQELITRLALSDLYKLNYYMDGTVSDLFKIPINQLVDKCIVDVGLVVDLLESSKLFNDMDYVSKTLLLEVMEEHDQDRIISSIYKFHTLDKLTYVIVDNLENYKEYYKEYLEVNKDKPNRITTIVEYISYRLINLKFEDENKYKKNILEFIKAYYKWKNFIKNHDGQYLINKCDLTYIDIINCKPIDEIFTYIEDDFDFLYTIVGDYLHYKTQNIEIKEEIVDEYFNSSSSEKLKQKLMVKDN